AVAAEALRAQRDAARRGDAPRRRRDCRRRITRRRHGGAGDELQPCRPRSPEESMSGEAIRIDNLTVRYGRKTAVDGVSLSVAPGAVYALLGRNGAGKSSLVR